LEGVGDGDIARLRDSIQNRLDKASAHSEMYANKLDNQMDDILGKTEIELQLEERKRRLGLSTPSTPSFEEEESEDVDVSSLEE
jgi:hypothetical protein